MSERVSSWHIAVAAEAFAAGAFARCGYDVSIQYGADQPEYDLIIAKAEQMLKVSVKGSQDGSWGLTQSYLAKANTKGQTGNYHGAVDLWLLKHKPRTVFCFVQFRDVPIDTLPRMYLATPAEVASRLKGAAAGRGDTILYEDHSWSARAVGAGTTERIPQNWRFSPSRVAELLAGASLS
jgi:hypothetical protein